MLTARGCPYRCAFCADKSMWKGKVRRRSIESVIDELRHIKNTYHVELIDFQDGTFTFDRDYVERFCDAVIGNNLKLSWGCTARYDNLDERLIDLMKNAGCSGMYFGLESGSNRMLEAVGKRTTVEQIIEVSDMIYSSGIPSATSVILGLPEEGKQDIEATLSLMQKVKTDIFDVNSYVPLPGSPLFEEMASRDKNGIDWGTAAYKSLDNHFSRVITLDELRGYLLTAYRIADDVRKTTLSRYQSAVRDSGQISSI